MKGNVRFVGWAELAKPNVFTADVGLHCIQPKLQVMGNRSSSVCCFKAVGKLDNLAAKVGGFRQLLWACGLNECEDGLSANEGAITT